MQMSAPLQKEVDRWEHRTGKEKISADEKTGLYFVRYDIAATLPEVGKAADKRVQKGSVPKFASILIEHSGRNTISKVFTVVLVKCR